MNLFIAKVEFKSVNVSKVKNILVSQPVPVDLEKSPYGELIKKHGVSIEFIKFFSIAKDVRVEIPETMKYFCMSESVAFYLQKYVQFRKRKIFFSENDLSQLMDLIKKHKTERFLLPCSDNHSKELPLLLENAKINFSEAILYRTVPSEMKADVDISKFDMLVFFSPQGIRSLYHNWPDFKQDEVTIGAFGTTTTLAATEAGLKVNVSAPNPTTPSMTMAIDAFLSKCQKKSV